MELRFTLWNIGLAAIRYEMRHMTHARYIGRNHGPIFHRLWTKVYQIKYRRDCSSERRFPFDDILFSSETFAIKFGSDRKLPQILMFWAANFWGRRGPKFLTQFYKFRSLSNKFQNLVTIDRVTAQIRRILGLHLKYMEL